MSNICIIPARGGSKRIPRKNIKNFNGRPVIYYAISNALNSGLFDEVMVSTDDDEIARISIELGAKVPFFRSKETADDDASTADVIIEVLKKYKDLNIYFDNVCCIYPVTPLLPCSKLNTSFDKFISNNYNSLITIKKYSHPIQRAFSLKENKIEINDEEYFASKTQDLESNYFDAGQFYWLNIDYFLKNKKMISDNTGYIELHEFESEDIDNDRDWNLAILKFTIKNKLSKLVIGSAQFGFEYGISNIEGITTDKELEGIFSLANEFGIEYIDTAFAYGTSEERIGIYNNNHLNIITKFSDVENKDQLNNLFSKSLHKLKTNSIYGYLAHNANIIIENPKLWDALIELKQSGKVKKIGFSLYQPEQMEKLIALNCIPDLVQLPYSIFDKKFEKQLIILKNLGVEIHVRSVFLQGIYFMNPNQLPKKLQPLKSAIVELQNICKEEYVSIAHVALNYLISNPNIDKLVFGIESVKQLKQNINCLLENSELSTVFSKIDAIKINDKSLLNPTNW